MVISERTKVAGEIAATIIAAPFLLILFLPAIIYFAILDWRGKMPVPASFHAGNPWHDECVRWKEQRRDYDRSE
jgi:hypothetical protein